MTMPKMPEVAVIIPCYNCEKWIDECMESLVNQTFTDFVIIAVDDGSTDDTASRLDEWSRRDRRVTVIRQPNGGVSAARNAGIAAALGNCKWIAFVDADDWVAEDYLERLVNAADDVDWVMSGARYMLDGKETFSEGPEEDMTISVSTPDGLFMIATQPMVTMPVGKLYSNRIVEKAGLMFDPRLSYGEDRDFNVRYLPYVKCYNTLSYRGYYYRRDIDGSLSQLKSGDILGGDIDYWNKLKALLDADGQLSPEVRRRLANRLYNFINDVVAQRDLTPAETAMLRERADMGFLRRNISAVSGNFAAKFLISRGKFGLARKFYTLRG